MTISLRDAWELRNSAAATLLNTEDKFRAMLDSATCDDVVALLEAFSPARSPGPDWTRSFDPLMERLWTWCDPALLSQAEQNFRARGPGWLAVANALSPDNGARLRAQLHQLPSARMPSFTTG